MKSAEQIKNAMAHYYGTEAYHRWSPLFPTFVLTDGAHMIAQDAEAYWLMDAIASHANEHTEEGFQSVTLTVKDNSAVLEITDGNSKVIARQEIPYTDFPLDEIKMFCILGSIDGVNPQWVIMLHTEY
jgi:hypothetical protein